MTEPSQSKAEAQPKPNASEQAEAPRMEKWSVELERQIAQELAASPPAFRGDGSKPVYTIDTPPPYPSGRWHIGAVAGYSLIDMIARAKRKQGYDVLFPWGTDRNGINIEFTVEKASGKPMKMWDRAAFNDACREAISVYSDDMKRIGRRIGLSCDFDQGYETDSPDYRGFSQSCFLELYRKGRIVEDLRPNTYDPKLQTTIADAEVYYEERKTRLNHVKWTVEETGETIIVSTTRPELICACQVVLVHPDHEPTQHLIGKHAKLPVGDRSVEIRAHPHVKTDFGSGIMMVCSFGDQADVALFRELQLEPIQAIGLDGRMTDVAGSLAGLKVEEAKKQIIEELESAGLMEGFDTVQQKFPISERSKAAVETILLKEWYVKQTDCVDELRKVAKEMDFLPTKHRQLLLDWIDTVSIDWPISRRRYYHTEIPLWYVLDADGNEMDAMVVPPGETYYRPWAEAPPAGSRVLHRMTREDLGDVQAFLAANPGATLRGETKVFDTWMDSSVSNLYITMDYADQAWHADHVTSIRPQGRDIVRTWLYYTLLKTHLLHGRPGFEKAMIHGMGMDKHGRKMSKSVGNVIDPDEIVEQMGSDAFRLWIAGECSVGDDFRINPEKIRGASKFLQKLGNVVSFIDRFERGTLENLQPEDEWILSEWARVEAMAKRSYDELDFFTAATELRSFVWNVFAPHYMEMVKVRAYDGDPAACATLHHIVGAVLRTLSPLIPFSTHYWANWLGIGSVHAGEFPATESVLDAKDVEERTRQILDFNSEVWRQKKDQGISLGAPISGVAIPEALQPYAAAFQAMHKLE